MYEIKIKVLESEKEHDNYEHFCGKKGDDCDAEDKNDCSDFEECLADHIIAFPGNPDMGFGQLMSSIERQTKDDLKVAVQAQIKLIETIIEKFMKNQKSADC